MFCCFVPKPSEETIEYLNKIMFFFHIYVYILIWTCNQGVHFYMSGVLVTTKLTVDVWEHIHNKFTQNYLMILYCINSIHAVNVTQSTVMMAQVAL